MCHKGRTGCFAELGVAEVNKMGASGDLHIGRCLKVWPNVILLGVTYGVQHCISSQVENHHSNRTSQTPVCEDSAGGLVKVQILPW